MDNRKLSARAKIIQEMMPKIYALPSWIRHLSPQSMTAGALLLSTLSPALQFTSAVLVLIHINALS